MLSVCFLTAVALLNIRAGDIMQSSAVTENDLPLLEPLSSGPSARARLGNNSNDLGCAVNCWERQWKPTQMTKALLVRKQCTLTVQRKALKYFSFLDGACRAAGSTLANWRWMKLNELRLPFFRFHLDLVTKFKPGNSSTKWQATQDGETNCCKAEIIVVHHK